MLTYRMFGCCSKLGAKLLHTILYLMAVPCIVVSTIAVFDSHDLRDEPIPNLYSLHSWMGLVTIGLFALQVTHTVRHKLTIKIEKIYASSAWDGIEPWRKSTNIAEQPWSMNQLCCKFYQHTFTSMGYTLIFWVMHWNSLHSIHFF